MLTSLAAAWRAHARTLAHTVTELLLPPACVVCERQVEGRDSGMVCGLCWTRVATLPKPQCQRCGHPTVVGSCRWCPLLPPFVRCARSWCWIPGGTAERIVHAFKYDGWHRLAPELAERMVRIAWPDDVLAERTALVPVPLAAARRRERGYNQSEVLADALALAWRIPVWRDVIERPRATSSQTRLTPEQRLANVANAFRVAARGTDRLRDAHLVLVDDVITTGATLNACAAALIQSGARVISYVTFGRARAPGDAPLTRGRAEHGH